MTDEQHKKQHQRVDTLFHYWPQVLGLEHWRIDCKVSKEHPSVFDDERSIMHVTCDWRYMTATITVFAPVIAEMDDEELEYSFLHELAHLFLCELRSNNPKPHEIDHEERVATQLALSWQWVRDAQQKERNQDE